MRLAKKRNRVLNHIRRDVLNYRYIKRNILAALLVTGTAVTLGVVIRYGERLDHTDSYLSNTIEVSSSSAPIMDEESIAVVMDSVNDNSTKKTAKQNDILTGSDNEDKTKSLAGSSFVARVDDTLNVRKEASTESDIIGKLTDGNVGEVVEEAGEWIKISSGAVTGYVKSEYILTGEAAEEYAKTHKNMVGTITSETVNVRADKSTEADIIELVAEGTTMKVAENDSDWVKVVLGSGDEGFVSAEYIDVKEINRYAMTIEEYNQLYGESGFDTQENTETASEEAAASEEQTEAPTEEATETPTEEATETPTEEVTETPTEEATETPTEEVTEAPTEETTEANSDTFDFSQYDDAYLIACLVSMEAGYECYDGQLAVANVVLNRVRSGAWGSSVADVITAPNQFPCVTGDVMGSYLENGPLDTAVQAANDALSGNNNIGNFMSFLNYRYIDTDTLSDYVIIGNHCFY